MRSTIGCFWRRTVGSVVIAALTAIAAPAHASTPKFHDYTVKVDQRPSVAPMLVGEAKTYKTRLKAATGQKPNFAGHYFLVTWGCGTRCETGAVVDIRNGAVTFLPGYVTEWHEGDQPFWFRADSSLFVFSGHLDEQDAYSARYYMIADGTFRFIQDVVTEPVQQNMSSLMPSAGPVAASQQPTSRADDNPLARDPKIGPLISCYESGYQKAIAAIAKNAGSEKDYIFALLVAGGPSRLAALAQSYCDPAYRETDVPGADKEANIRAIGPLFLAYVMKQERDWLSACERRRDSSDWREVAEQCSHFRSLRYRDDR